MQENLILVGYRSFTSKSSNKCYVIDFISQPKKLHDGTGMYVSNVSVFTDDKKYNDFLSKHKLLETVALSFEVVGKKVSYIL